MWYNSREADDNLTKYFMNKFGRYPEEGFAGVKRSGIGYAAVNLYSDGISKEIISKCTGLSLDKIDKLIEYDKQYPLEPHDVD